MKQEQQPSTAEQKITVEAHTKSAETHKQRIEQLHEHSSRNSESVKPSIDQLVERVEQEAIQGNEHARSEVHRHTPTNMHPARISKELITISYQRSLTRMRKQLRLPSRGLSKVIHNPVIEAVSDATGKTVARPSSMLGGAFFAAVGSGILLWTVDRYGYEYNYLAVIVLFIAGMFAGLIVEASIKLLRRRS